MCMILRYVHLDKANQRWEIKESFVKFTDISSAKTGLLITGAATTELEALGLDLDDMRGQGFDNGAPMKCKNVGVQRRILNQNPRPFFNPCGNHSLNLTVNDAADSTLIGTQYFATVQKIYVFLSAATNRWDVLKKHLIPAKAKTPKPLCTTRWSSRINAIKPLCKNSGEIIAALREIEDTESFNKDVRFEAGTLADKIDFIFICCTCFRYDILSHTNIASKALQTIQSNVQTALTSLESVMNFLESYKENGCEKVLNEATEICERISIEDEFDHQKRRAGRTTVTNAEEFETKVFLPIIESATDSVTDRFKALKQHSELFSFLYDFENYEANRNNGSLQKSCKKLEIALTHDGKSDIDGDDLFVELSLVSNNMPMGSYETKQFAKKHDIEIITSSPNFPQSNGMAEKAVGICKNILRKSENEEDILRALLAYRTTPTKNMSYSPAQLIQNRNLRTELPMHINKFRLELCIDVEKQQQAKQKIS
ncbi:uncharacterized protein LOC129570827 [Sitodiplosis mosellana]|uniref:uncharacterized protein LOC129570827 n=1 Tax=Sitodiplosis mosellana TaxID=263140 RepID=UPI0024447793|nr:uncharacterized protein LOC129570827 [Sitodiplosis mosellana]